MKEKTLSIPFREYAHAGELDEGERELVEAAGEQLRKAYAPYSHFLVGAAIRLENGIVLGGANQENAAYPMCLCAERSALATAASVYPGLRVVAMAITSRNKEQTVQPPAAPCGACRQVISETEDRFKAPMVILLAAGSGPVYRFEKGKDLLPLAFTGDFLL